MTTVEETAKAFAAGQPASCHNARTDGSRYWLHGHLIAEKQEGRTLRLTWAGWRTATTQNHLKHITRAWTGEAASIKRAEGPDSWII